MEIEKMGELGTNIPVDIAEKEEDLLETLYSDWREGKSMLLSDVQSRTGLKLRELNQLIRRLMRHGCLEEPGEDNLLKLTDIGKSQGEESVSRHRVLTQFIQMISGQGSKQSESEACRLEHLISKETVDGLDDFIRNGDTFDRVFTDTDLCNIVFYEEGTYTMQMGLYYCGRSCPRILVRGFEGFEGQVQMVVEKSSSAFRLRRYGDELPKTLWYIRNGEWERAEKQGDDWILPTRLFEIEKSADLPIIEASLTVALPEKDLAPIVLDCMDMIVHIW